MSDDGPAVSLGEKVRSGMGWSLVNTASVRLLTLGSGMIIARLIAPRDYGVYAIGYLVLMILTSMNELGVSVAVVRSEKDPTPMAPTAVTLSVGMSTTLYLVIALTAPLVAHLLRAPSATNVIRVIGLNVILDGISSIPAALMTRQFHQGRRAVVDLAAFFPGAGASIGLIAHGWGPMGLALGSLAGNITAVTLVYALAPARPLPGWRTDDARTLVRAGLPFAATSLVYLAILNVDYIVVGRLLGTLALGFYVLAFNLSSWPANIVTMTIRRVAIPGFSQLAHDRLALRRAFLRSLHVVAGVAILVALLLALLAQPVVTVFYGRNWAPAVQALRFLAILGAARVAMDLGYDLLVGVDRGRLLLLVQVTWLVALVVALPIGAHLNGIQGVAIGHVVVALGVVAPMLAIALHRAAGMSPRSTATALAWPAAAGGITAALLAIAGLIPLGPWAQLTVVGTVAGGLYLTMMCLEQENRILAARMIARLRQ